MYIENIDTKGSQDKVPASLFDNLYPQSTNDNYYS